MKKVFAVQDESGHWYIIPFEFKDEFFRDEEMEKEGDFSYFEDKYSRYMTGGDLNLIQLYAEI
jgi:hypothetical protein